MNESYQENNLDIDGRFAWRIAPSYEMGKRAAPPFVISESGRFSALPQFFSRREGIEGFLFIYTQSGKGLLKYKDGEHELLPGSIALIDCRLRHEYRTFDEAGAWDFYWLHCLDGNIGFYLQIIYGDSFAPLDAGDEPVQMFEDVLENIQYSDPRTLLKLSDCVNSLLKLMAEAPDIKKPRNAKDAEMNEAMKSAAKYLKDHHWLPFKLEELARGYNMTKFNFIREFKEHMGTTPHNFLTAERINASKILLQTTDTPISKICMTVGYGDESNYTRKFKELTGATPRAFRLGKRR